MWKRIDWLIGFLGGHRRLSILLGYLFLLDIVVTALGFAPSQYSILPIGTLVMLIVLRLMFLSLVVGGMESKDG